MFVSRRVDPLIVSPNRPTLARRECSDVVRRPSGNAPGARFGAREIRPGLVAIDVRGEIDMLSTPSLRAYVSALLVDDVALVLDLSGVTFFGTDGLAVLIDLEDDATETGRRWSIVTCLSLQRLLRATAMESRFPQHGSRMSATAALAGIVR